ncbi:hypothetical protein [Calothrix sp. CCY 0018]|uniref:hypothetical protein n=1 Tax=Calothrix sp. CCY 0018 TaxID=3103864 RepID=UPI0039C69C7B
MNNYELIKTLSSQSIEPRQFLRYSFGIDKLAPEEALEEETSFGYCTKCVRLLSKILGLQRKTVREWGHNPNFEGMPQHARTTYNYALMALSREELNKIEASDSQAPAITAAQFIEEVFLKELSPSDRLKIVTSTKFRGQCFAILSEVLKVSKSAIYEWGRDIELKNMPKHYQHTLAYALKAYKKQQATGAKQNAA